VQLDNTRFAIRRAEANDAAALSALVQAAYMPWVEVIGRRPVPMDEDYAVRCAAGQAWLLEDDAVPIGALVMEDRAGHLFLKNVAVDPARHRQGIGRALMRFVEDEARRRGYGEVQLNTSEGMARNVTLYKRLGYVLIERQNAGAFDRLTMAKRLC
jgi:GNAT superfamily N-acetyltransferase